MPTRVTMVSLPGVPSILSENSGKNEDHGPSHETDGNDGDGELALLHQGAANVIANLSLSKNILRPPRNLWDKVRQRVSNIIEKDFDDASNRQQTWMGDANDTDSDLNAEPKVLPRKSWSTRKLTPLGAVQACKVLRGLSTRLQVRIARHLRPFCIQASMEAHKQVFTAGSSDVSQNALLIIESGFMELVTSGCQGEEVLIGRLGRESMLGAVRALGLVSSHLISVRVPVLREGSDDDGDEEPNEQVSGFMVTGAELQEMRIDFQQDMAHFCKRVMQDLRLQLMPRIARTMSQGHFFRRYNVNFVKALARDLDVRLCKPGELIFKEKSPARSMAILCSGAVDVYLNGKVIVENLSGCGLEFGEAALLDSGCPRSATVRCSKLSECMICLLHEDVFQAAFEEFPEEHLRLEDQIRTRLTMLMLNDMDGNRFVKEVDPQFVQFVSTFGEVVNAAWGNWVCDIGVGEEVLHIVYMGRASVERYGADGQCLGDLGEMLTHGESIGFEAVMGLRRGPPQYRLVAGRGGCTFIRLTREAFRESFGHFPTMYQVLLKTLDLSRDNLESARAEAEEPCEEETHMRIVEVFNQALGTADFEMTHWQALRPHLEICIYEPGVTITEEGKCGRAMVLLMDGTVSWTRAGIMDVVATAPRHFDEGILMGLQLEQAATIVAKTTCVVWNVNLDRAEPPSTSLSAAARRKLLFAQKSTMVEARDHHAVEDTMLAEALNFIKEAGEQRRHMVDKLQARLRNMKTFRRFRSEILALICENLLIRTFLPDQSIFREGDTSECIYIVLKGRAEGHAHGKTSILDEGATFGEMVLFGQMTRTTTVRAITLCVCNAVYKTFITHAFMLFPDEHVDPTPSPTVSRVQATEDKAPEFFKDHRRGVRPTVSGRKTYIHQKLGFTGTDFHVRMGAGGIKRHPSSDRMPAGTFSRRSDSCSSIASLPSEEHEEAGTVSLHENWQADGSHEPEHQADRPRLWERFSRQRAGRPDAPLPPQLPLADCRLYLTPLTAEENLVEAFAGVLPLSDVKNHARMHGIRTVKVSDNSRDRSTSSWRVSSAESNSRALRVWPTSTSPAERLPPVTPRPREAEQALAVARHLQVLSSSLLRISSKRADSPRGLNELGLHEWHDKLPEAVPRDSKNTLLRSGKPKSRDQGRNKRVEAMREQYLAPPLELRAPLSARSQRAVTSGANGVSGTSGKYSSLSRTRRPQLETRAANGERQSTTSRRSEAEGLPASGSRPFRKQAIEVPRELVVNDDFEVDERSRRGPTIPSFSTRPSIVGMSRLPAGTCDLDIEPNEGLSAGVPQQQLQKLNSSEDGMRLPMVGNERRATRKSFAGITQQNLQNFNSSEEGMEVPTVRNERRTTRKSFAGSRKCTVHFTDEDVAKTEAAIANLLRDEILCDVSGSAADMVTGAIASFQRNLSSEGRVSLVPRQQIDFTATVEEIGSILPKTVTSRSEDSLAESTICCAVEAAIASLLPAVDEAVVADIMTNAEAAIASLTRPKPSTKANLLETETAHEGTS